jgi:hypothetical protein
MNIFKYSFLISACLFLLSACIQPPTFYSTVIVYAVDNGSNVDFTVKVSNNPTSVTCFNNSVTMTRTSGDNFTGTADYTNDLLVRPGKNTVNCKAVGSNSTITSTVGFIELIPDVPPNVVIIQPVDICGNNGSLSLDEPLIKFPDTTNVTGASYTLTQGTLPSGLSIKSSNGNLIGTATAGDHLITNLAITANTAAGSDESALFDVTLDDAVCP